jgi:hypothetical protein
MSASHQPQDASDPTATAAGAGTPAQSEAPETAETQGYMLLYCSACLHTHSQSDPKCKPSCPHGTTSFHPGGNTTTAY